MLEFHDPRSPKASQPEPYELRVDLKSQFTSNWFLHFVFQCCNVL